MLLVLAGGAAARADEQRKLSHGGRERDYLLLVPSKPLSPAPLLVVLHGGDSDVGWMRTLTRKRFEKLAEDEGWLLVYPSGVNNVWNDGRYGDQSAAPMSRTDDVGFIASVLDAVDAEVRIDRERVYVTGASNGGMMAHRLAIDLPDRFAAAAPVMAQIPAAVASRTPPLRPLAILLVNGDEDPIVPYEGGHVHYLTQKFGAVISTDETVRYWAKINRCTGEPAREKLPDLDPKDGTRVERETWEGAAPVIRYRVEGGGHTWPGGTQYLPKFAIGRTSKDMDAADVIFAFFKEQRRRPARRIF